MNPSSLRDLYIDPSQAWTFVPPIPAAAVKAASQRLPEGLNAPVHQWSMRPSPNSIFDLSPSLDLSEPSGINAAQLFKAIVASAILQYTSTAIVMPWEVGKMLLQVQWVPRDAGEPEPLDSEVVEDDHDDAMSDSSNDNDSYFTDPNGVSTNRPPTLRARTDEQGYVIRQSVLEEGTRPEYIIPVGSADGVWGMMKRVGRFRPEGWLALWKGLLTSCVTEVLSDTLQPFINGFLQSLFFPSMSPFHQPPIILPVVSHLITGFLLSPLDLIRSRLIVQSFTARYQTYSGPLDAFRQILRDEGGLWGMYFHPHLLIPTLLDNALRPIVSLALPGMLTRYMGRGHITEETYPIGWGIAELGGSCIGLLATLPIETIRRRLQVQSRGSGKPLKGCVELRPAPYNGVVDTFWHILTEERSDLPIRGRKEREGEIGESWFRNTGIGQLYRGLGMRLGASVIVFSLALIGGSEERDGGWAEI